MLDCSDGTEMFIRISFFNALFSSEILVKDGIGPIGLRASELCSVIRSQININSGVQKLSAV